MPDTTPRSDADLTAQGWAPMLDGGFAEHTGPLWMRGEGVGLEIAVQTDARHRNHNGGVHGGVLAALMDHTLGNVGRAAVGGQAVATVQMEVQFLSPGRLGDFLIGRATVMRQTRTLVFVRCEVESDGRAVAAGSGVLKILGA
jgi:uncharacterized protein (TIGR00369 family)